MKKCTWCGREYGDEAMVCDVDSRPLNALLSEPVASPQPAVPPRLARNPAWALPVAVTILVLVNTLIAFTTSLGGLSFRLGAAASQLIIPVLIALGFSIGHRFRNPRAWTQIFLWVSVTLLLAKLGAQLGVDGREHFSRGNYLYEHHRFERAAAEFTKCLSYELTGNPSKAEVLAGRACAYGRMGKSDAAIADLQAVLQLDPQNAKASELLDALRAFDLSSRTEGVSRFLLPDAMMKTNPLTQQDVPALVAALTGKVDSVRLAVVKALGELGPAATNAVPTLRNTEQTDPDPKIRVAAKSALTKIDDATAESGR